MGRNAVDREWRVLRRALAVLVSAVAAVAIAACGGSNSGATANSSSAASSGGKTLGVTLPYVQGSFYVGMIYGVDQEAAKLGYHVLVESAGGFTNPDLQVTQFGELVTRKVAAILVDPIDPATLHTAIAQARAAKIPIVGAGDPVPGANSSVHSSHCTIGMDLANATERFLPSGGTVGGLAGPAGATWSTERWRCFVKRLAQKPNIKIGEQQTSDDTADLGVSLTRSFLERSPDLSLIYGADSVIGEAAALAVQQAHRCGQTKVVTANLTTAGEALLRKHCLSLVAAQQTVAIGRDVVDIAVRLAEGKSAPADVTVPIVDVTAANLRTVNLANLLRAGS